MNIKKVKIVEKGIEVKNTHTPVCQSSKEYYFVKCPTIC